MFILEKRGCLIIMLENVIEIVDPYGFIYITTNMINGKKYIGQKSLIEI